MLDELKEDLVGIDIRFDEPLKRYTYTKVGGPADYLAFPRNRYELARIVKFANKHDIPWMVLGNASNLIVRDGGIRGFVIMFDRLNGITVNGYQIEAEAGANLIATTKVARFQSLTGFEFAAGIPGSVGGAVFMNAGAYGGEIAHILVSAQVLTKDGDIRTIDARDMRFGYRRSVLQETGEVVISAKFNLKPGDYEQIKNEMNRLNHLRELKQPLEYPSCGSVFKRPPGHFAGQLIMEANLKGHRIGGVEVSTKHAGFMVNVDHGTAKDYEDLIADVIAKVKENSGVTLEPEVRIIGVATTMPRPVLPWENLIGRHIPRLGQTYKSVDCNVQPRPVPIIVIGIHSQNAVIRLHIPPQIGIVGPCGVHHHPTGALIVSGVSAVPICWRLPHLRLIPAVAVISDCHLLPHRHGFSRVS